MGLLPTAPKDKASTETRKRFSVAHADIVRRYNMLKDYIFIDPTHPAQTIFDGLGADGKACLEFLSDLATLANKFVPGSVDAKLPAIMKIASTGEVSLISYPTVLVNWNIDDLEHREHGGSVVLNVALDFGSVTPDLTKLSFVVDNGGSLRDADDAVLQFPFGTMPTVLNLNLVGNVAVYDFGGARLPDGVYDVVYDGEMVATIHSFFGDVNGNREIDDEDKTAWDAAVNQSKYIGEQEDELNPTYNRNLDFNDDEFTDTEDLNRYKDNLGKHLDY